MSDDGGLKPTGHEIREPAATLVELTDGERWFTAIQFDPAFHTMPEITSSIDLIRPFMEHPMVTGLAELRPGGSTPGQFIYETGKIWTLAEVLRRFRDIGQPCGPRAALQLCWLAGQILQEAGETGPREGCYSHGNVSPWRIALKGNGSAQVFGYGIPQVEWLAHLQGHPGLVEPNSLHFLPPERLDGGGEDPSADTCSLTLLAIEMMTGRPLYDGNTAAKLQKQIGLAEGSTKLAQKKVAGIPKAVQEVFSRALIFDPDTRLSGQAFLDEIKTLLELKTVKGDSLTKVMTRMRGADRGAPAGRKLSHASTAAFTPEMIADIAKEAEAEQAEHKQTEREGRWAKVERDEAPTRKRRGKAAATEEPKADEEPSRRRRRRTEPEPEAPAAEQPARRRRRGAKAEAAVEEKPADEASVEPPKEAEEAPARRRRRRGAATEEEAPAAVEKEVPPEEKPRRQRRRSTPAESEAKAAPTPEAEPPAEEEAPRRRRRRGSEDPEVAAAPEPEKAEKEAAPRQRRRRRTE